MDNTALIDEGTALLNRSVRVKYRLVDQGARSGYLLKRASFIAVRKHFWTLPSSRFFELVIAGPLNLKSFFAFVRSA